MYLSRKHTKPFLTGLFLPTSNIQASSFGHIYLNIVSSIFDQWAKNHTTAWHMVGFHRCVLRSINIRNSPHNTPWMHLTPDKVFSPICTITFDVTLSHFRSKKFIHHVSHSTIVLFKMLPQKNHPKDILRDKNHFYRIVLVHFTSNAVLNKRKYFQMAGYWIIEF